MTDRQLDDTAFIFNKYVLHRSVPLFGGENEIRSAFVFRLSGLDARYDKTRVDKLHYARQNFEYSGSSAFNELVAEKDGELIINSKIFSDVKNRTTVSL